MTSFEKSQPDAYAYELPEGVNEGDPIMTYQMPLEHNPDARKLLELGGVALIGGIEMGEDG